MTTATLEPRMTNPVFVIPDALEHLLALAKAIRKAGLPETTGYLVDLRSPCLSARRRPRISAFHSAVLWVPWSNRSTSLSKEPSLSSTVQAAVTGPGLCPPPSKWMVASLITLGAFCLTA